MVPTGGLPEQGGMVLISFPKGMSVANLGLYKDENSAQEARSARAGESRVRGLRAGAPHTINAKWEGDIWFV